MTKLTRFFGACLLVVSLSAVALADGEPGATQGPPAPPPPPAAQCVTEGAEVADSTQPVQEAWVDVETAADMFANWLVMSIF